jgi:hypothetical protein
MYSMYAYCRLLELHLLSFETAAKSSAGDMLVAAITTATAIALVRTLLHAAVFASATAAARNATASAGL